MAIMGHWQRMLRRFVPGKVGIDEADAQALRVEFQARYHQFKLLLSANNRALEIMTELEKALEGTRPFGMKFIRSHTMGAYTRVYQIVRHLDQLAPGRYPALGERLASIHRELDALVTPAHDTDTAGPLIIAFDALDITHADQAGMKMAGLAEVAHRLDIKVPDGFVITAAAFRRFLAQNDLQTEILRRIQQAETDGAHRIYTISAEIRQLIENTPLPDDLAAAIMGAYDALSARCGRPVHLAVRSSALGEDREGASFAGLYHSALNVSGDQLIASYRQVVAAAYSPSVMAYRLSRGLIEEESEMCVGVMEMVDAVSGGVLYSTNPMDIRDRSITINAVWGLPKSVVDGTAATDLFRVSRAPAPAIAERSIAAKARKYVCYPGEGVCRMDKTGPDSARACLTDEQILALADMAVSIESFSGRPQDIEWAIDRAGAIVLLQCRPLQVMTGTAPEPLAEECRAGEHCPIYQGGTTASPGVAAGPVQRVIKDVDALRFPDGAVLLTDRALARWAALLPRAAAVVSETGSLTGHLANVAREFKVPALFGAAGVIDRLDGHTAVTVDADTARIYDGVLTTLLDADARKEDAGIMKGTPIYAVLEKCAARITPLNLLDPDSPSFSAVNCKTLHDITRFCHEKSVHEMFRFGKAHRFPERSSKQLRARIPMQWWVLNLDDGFRASVGSERYVDIDNVVSIPMLALWTGITAFPWAGPPPVDGKGFVSVMFQATQNQALLPTVRTSMANRNYFMISRNYCSLQSRLGFHFAITEALVGDRTPENYVAFQFKGGAADYARRLKRVQLVREILESHGFSTTVTKDALRARIEHHNADTMTQKLKILGYLTIHTRQLDMIMSNPAMVRHYRAELLERIEALLAVSPALPAERTTHVGSHQS